MTATRMSVVQLSRGATWNPNPSEPPYLAAPIGRPWPEGADCYTVFTDSAGVELATIAADSVSRNEIRFIADATDVDAIPAGANFETFLDTDDGLAMIRYGKVIRREAEFFDAPAVQQAAVALNYVDTFPTLGLRSNWKPISGRTRVYSNAGTSQPNGVSSNGALFFAQSSIRWDTPLNSDTVKSRVVLLNQGVGKVTVIVCADQRFTSYLAVQFSSATNVVNMCIGSGPNTVAYQSTATSHTVVDLADYTVTYDDLSKTLAVYQGTNLTPLKTWTDTLGVVPHGPGYRYAGFAFDTGILFSPGIEVCGWQAKDD